MFLQYLIKVDPIHSSSFHHIKSIEAGPVGENPLQTPLPQKGTKARDGPVEKTPAESPKVAEANLRGGWTVRCEVLRIFASVVTQAAAVVVGHVHVESMDG